MYYDKNLFINDIIKIKNFNNLKTIDNNIKYFTNDDVSLSLYGNIKKSNYDDLVMRTIILLGIYNSNYSQRKLTSFISNNYYLFSRLLNSNYNLNDREREIFKRSILAYLNDQISENDCISLLNTLELAIINGRNNVSNNLQVQSQVNSQSVSKPQITNPQVQNNKEENKPLPLNTEVIQRYMKDIMAHINNPSFRGWMLPNGQLLSEYTEKGLRQDHSKLVKIFLSGLEKFDPQSYEKVNKLYDEYRSKKDVYMSSDLDESFAVETLGWMQIAHFGRKNIVYRGERWQDRLLRPFLVDYGFRYEIANSGKSYELEFASLYDHIDEIIRLGLEKNLSLTR